VLLVGFIIRILKFNLLAMKISTASQYKSVIYKSLEFDIKSVIYKSLEFDIKLTEHTHLTHGSIRNAGTNIYFILLFWNIAGVERFSRMC